MNTETVEEIFIAYIKKDIELSKTEFVESNGHPFTICTNGARWIKETFFKDANAKVVGYAIWNNPTAEIGQDHDGHDFILVEDRYIIDFWYRHVEDKKEAPIFLDIKTQMDLVTKYYGDPLKWETLNKKS